VLSGPLALPHAWFSNA